MKNVKELKKITERLLYAILISTIELSIKEKYLNVNMFVI